MATHSYFFYLLFDGVDVLDGRNGDFIFTGSSPITPEEVFRELALISDSKLRSFQSGWRKGRVLFGHLLVLPSTDESGNIREILVEGSLSWFLEGEDDLQNLFTCLRNMGCKFLLLPDGSKQSLENPEKAKKRLVIYYSEKLRRFKELYPDRRVRAHSEEFYSLYRGWIGLVKRFFHKCRGG